MANEWTLTDRTEDPLDYIVADGVAIEKGSLLKMTDPATASLSDGSADVLCGVSARSKVADDGTTQLAVFKKGRFFATCSGAVVVGGALVSGLTGSLNYVSQSSSTANSGAVVLGYAEETGSNGETIQVRLDL